ncbi:MAG TPA: sigma-54 dependent transcriptional regulator [Candidatus Binatia bacterium]|jgi:NtrC-family two-component system response regulator AlgB|nr:sigma-54 dependent transcriptional regulator [Candidatus Binatia bacterium]
MEAHQPSAEVTGKIRVLIIDDEKNIRTTLSLCLEQMDCHVKAVSSVDGALAALRHESFDVAFLDLRLGEANGLEIIPKLLAESAELMIVMMTAFATIDSAVEAIKRGAADYLPKPFQPAQIRHLIDQCIKRRELTRQVTDLESRLREAAPEVELDSDSPKVRAVLEIAERASAADVPVLLRGESGTGKTVLARTIHSLSPRSKHPFTVVNCPTLSEELLTSELFGHSRGAFTGAVRDQPGRVEAAEGGTLFLDEIGDISPSLQAKLLRFLEEKEFERLGENKTRRANVRTIAATNREIEDHVRRGLFREDLLYRLNVVDLQLPPLRERPEDILRLARRFLAFFAKSARRQPQELSKAAEDALLSYVWPGNIRELRNAIERTAILWPAPVIEPEAFPAHISAQAKSAAPQLGGDVTLDTIEREHITRVAARTSTLEEAAAILGIDASTLWRKRKKYET